MHIDKDYIIRIRRELHQVPEVGFDLPKSIAIIKRELDALAIPYTDEIGKSCIIATLNEGVGVKTIAIRADFDALPMQEETGLPFASTHPGKMHACGHECHAAMLLETAKALKEMASQIQCCVKFIFQSAEEILGGAKTICETGFMEQVDSIIACHIKPDYPVGTIALNRTCCHACSRGALMHLYGKSSHVARPHLGVDAIAMAMRVYDGIQLMRAREMDPIDRLVIGVGAIHGGQTNNIICDHVEMNLSIRTQDTALNEHIYQRITQIAESVAADMGGSAKLETYKFSPALHNDLSVADDIQAAAEKIIGKENILEKPESMGAEDFAYYLQHKPGAMFDLGVGTQGAPVIPIHNGKMVVNEDALVIAPQIFIQYILDQMEK